jgi:hypothetical protein
MSQGIEEMLNEWIERMPADKTTAEACATAYPEHAGELVPLVQLAQAIRDLPRPEPPARGLADVQAQVQRVARAKRDTERARNTPVLRRLAWRLAQVAIVVLVAAVLSMGSVTVVAESLPGSPLYQVKRAVEQVQFRITFDSQQQATLRLAYAERRTNEIVALAHRGQPVDEITLAVMLDETGIAIQQLRNLPPAVARTLLPRALNILDYQQVCLVHIRPDAPKAALMAIDQAIRICQERAELIRQMQNDLNRSLMK